MSGIAGRTAAASWVPVPAGSDFPLANLPFGAVAGPGGRAHLCVALGEHAVDLHVLARTGLLDGVCADAGAVFAAPSLNPLLACGRPAWRAARERLTELLSAGDERIREAGVVDAALFPRAGRQFVLPLDVRDYVDFYSSLEHATNLGKMFRPGGEPLMPNWRFIPIGYHGRTSTIVPSGSGIVRPRGQLKEGDAPPAFAPTRALDFELEVAFVTGDGPPHGEAIEADRARETIFGVVLLNDWSARDIQAWEYQPLGPFLGKSFATTLGTWIVTLDALEPYRVRGPVQRPEPLPHLAVHDAEHYDVALEVSLRSQAMARAGTEPHVVARTNFRELYWSMAQQLAHAASNGGRVSAGDLYGSGTISGATPDSYGSMIELTWRGARPLTLPDGSARAFLEDGDEVVMRGVAAAEGKPRIGLGTCAGTVLPARPA